jgi:hypothetical protein
MSLLPPVEVVAGDSQQRRISAQARGHSPGQFQTHAINHVMHPFAPY